ncbi:hypothetical protein HY628_03235 [Candidatus Uhrbacteria bacterium]|nr:hypothetical protein [Candidatus Uhrbacteria bacterium]
MNKIKKGKSLYQHIPRRAEVDKIAAEFVGRLAPDWWEKEVKGLKKLAVCQDCQAIYYDEHWHSWGRAKDLAKRLRKAGVRETVCFECQRVRQIGLEGERGYEGEALLSGWGSIEEKREILRLARNVGKRATLRDPEDQIIRLEDKGKQIRILTTENQLAISIGKQVDRARKGGKLEIKFSHQDAPVRVIWTGKKGS